MIATQTQKTEKELEKLTDSEIKNFLGVITEPDSSNYKGNGFVFLSAEVEGITYLTVRKSYKNGKEDVSNKVRLLIDGSYSPLAREVRMHLESNPIKAEMLYESHKGENIYIGSKEDAIGLLDKLDKERDYMFSHEIVARDGALYHIKVRDLSTFSVRNGDPGKEVFVREKGESIDDNIDSMMSMIHILTQEQHGQYGVEGFYSRFQGQKLSHDLINGLRFDN